MDLSFILWLTLKHTLKLLWHTVTIAIAITLRFSAYIANNGYSEELLCSLHNVLTCTFELGNKIYERYMMWHFIANSIGNDKRCQSASSARPRSDCMLCLIGLCTQVILIFEEVGRTLAAKYELFLDFILTDVLQKALHLYYMFYVSSILFFF